MSDASVVEFERTRAGLVPVMALAQRAGLAGLVAAHVRPGGQCGVNAHLKIPCLVAGMAAGADSIDGMDLLRHGAMPGLFGGIRAPSTLGSHLRSYTWGNVRQVEMVNRLLLAELARRAPLLPGPWPALPTARPAVRPSAVTSSTSPPAPPGTATGTSRCTCPRPGTASTNG